MSDKSTVLKHLAAVTNAASLESLWSFHVTLMQAYGFEKIIYGLTRFRVDENLGDPDDFMVLSNQDRAYLDQFFGDRMFINGPMIRWALENTGAQSWALITEKALETGLSKEEQRVLEFNMSWGVKAGYTISFQDSSPRYKGAIGLIGGPDQSQSDLDRIWQTHGDDLILINNVFHLKVKNLPYSNPKRALTKRQREVLEWVGDGKTIQDIATLLGRTSATVEKHLRLAREALGVETTAQAILKAAFHNQIFIGEVP